MFVFDSARRSSPVPRAHPVRSRFASHGRAQRRTTCATTRRNCSASVDTFVRTREFLVRIHYLITIMITSSYPFARFLVLGDSFSPRRRGKTTRHNHPPSVRKRRRGLWKLCLYERGKHHFSFHLFHPILLLIITRRVTVLFQRFQDSSFFSRSNRINCRQ